MTSVMKSPKVFAVDTYLSGKDITKAFVKVLLRVGYRDQRYDKSRYILVDWDRKIVHTKKTTNVKAYNLKADWLVAEKFSLAFLFSPGTYVRYHNPVMKVVTGKITRCEGPKFYVEGGNISIDRSCVLRGATPEEIVTCEGQRSAFYKLREKVYVTDPEMKHFGKRVKITGVIGPDITGHIRYETSYGTFSEKYLGREVF